MPTPREQLAPLVHALAEQDEPTPGARPFYEIMSDALVWTDERDGLDALRGRVMWPLRRLWRYRTALILEEPAEAHREWWDTGQELFPTWIGFLADRRAPSSVFARLVRMRRAGTKRWLENPPC